MTQEMCKLSIIIVNYNVKYFIEQCLLSIRMSVLPFSVEVFVVDNASADESISYLQPKFPEVKFIENDQNLGFSTANNIAIKQAAGDYVLLLNPDTVLGENVLQNTVQFMENNPMIGACGVKMINGKGEFLPESKRGFPTPWASFSKIFGLAKLFPHTKLFDQYNLGYLNENEPGRIDILSGAFMMIRKAALDKAGMLDESFFMYGEDIDLSYRITKAGYQNFYLPETIIHYKGESTDKNDARYVKTFYEAMSIFYKKHFDNHNKLYTFTINKAIGFRTFFSRLKQKSNRETNHSIKPREIVFSRESFSFEEIINKMIAHAGKAEFLIFSPESGVTIGSKIARKG